MQLHLRDSSQFIDEGFGNWLIPKIQSKLISKLRHYNLVNWDNYFKNTTDVQRLYKDSCYTASDIIIFAAKHLVCRGTDGDIVIGFSNATFVPTFDRLNLNTAVKMINYGTLDVKGCSIFTDTFEEFAKDIDTYMSLYYMI